MVSFTPQQQENPEGPNYMHYLGGTSQPAPNEAGKYKAAGAKLLEGIAKGADTMIESSIKQGIRKQVEAVQDSTIDELMDDYNKIVSGQGKLVSPLTGGTGAVAPRQGTTPSPLDIMPMGLHESVQTDTPEDIKSLPSKLEPIVGAKARGGLSNMYYDMKLRSIARDYRTRFPGYVQDIDRQVSEAAGSEMANKSINALISAINTFQSNQNASITKMQTELLQDRYQSALGQEWSTYWEAASRGDMQKVTEGLERAQPIIAHWHNMEMLKRQIDLNKDMNEEERKENRRRVLDEVYKGSAATFVNDILGVTSPEEIPQKIQQISQAPSEIQEQFVSKLKMAKALRINQVLNQVYSPDPKDPKKPTAASLWDNATALQTDINDAYKSVDNIIDAITNKETGSAGLEARLQLLKTQRLETDIDKEFPAAPLLRKLQKELPPDVYERYAQEITKETSKNKTIAQQADRMLQISSGIFSGTNSNGDPAPSPSTVLSQTKDALPEVRQKALDIAVDTMENKKLPDDKKVEAFHRVFNDFGLMDVFSTGYKDSITGVQVQGKEDVFRRILNPKMLTEGYRLGLGKEMEEWASNQLGHSLFKEAFTNLQKYGNPKELIQGLGTSTPPMRIKFNSNSNEFTADFGNSIKPNDPRRVGINNSLRVINMGLQTMAQFEQHNKNVPWQDAMHLAAEIMANNGLIMDGIPGATELPQMLANALTHTMAQQKSEEEKAKQKATDKFKEQESAQ